MVIINMLILASQSPRRKELLHKLVDDFLIIPADVDEHVKVDDVTDLPLEASKLKARAIKKLHPEADVIGSDTVVIIDGEILGKPHTEQEAFDMLKKLSGKKHIVVSGYCYIKGDKEIANKVITEVYFNELSDDLIKRYISTGSPMDKAGAYGIQDKEFDLVNKIKGSLDNVIGLPTEDIYEKCFKD